VNLTTILENIPTISLIIGIAIAIRELRKGPSETEARVTGSAVNVLDRVAKRLEEVEKELEELRAEMKKLDADYNWYQVGLGILIEQLQEHGITPRWTPDTPREDVLKLKGRPKPSQPKKRGF